MEQRFRPRPPIFIGHTVVKNTNKRKSPGFNDDITTERGSLVILQFLKLLLEASESCGTREVDG